MGLLTCECDHGRNEHLGAEEYDLDKRVLKCLHENCTCKHYRADEKTRKIKNDVYLRALFFPTIFGVLAILIFIGLHFAVSGFLSGFEITTPITTKLFYANGTMVPDQISPTPNESIQGLFDTVLGFVFFIAWYISIVSYLDFNISKRMKELKSL